MYCQLSNFLGVFPVIYCVLNQAYELAFVIGAAVIFSALYHIDESKDFFLFLDVLGCACLFAAALLVMQRSPNLLTVSNVFTLLYSAAAIAFFVACGWDTESKTYEVYHSLWHIFAIYGVCYFLYSHFQDPLHSKFLCKRPRLNSVAAQKKAKTTPRGASPVGAADQPLAQTVAPEALAPQTLAPQTVAQTVV